MEDEIIIEELENEEIIIEETDSNEIQVDNDSIVNIGTRNYKELNNKPSIEGVTLIDDKTFEDLGALSLTNTEIENLINLQV